MNTAIKSLDAENGRVGGYLVVWGSAEQRDLQGEYFTPQTDLCLEWYPARPVLYHHGLDGSLKAAVIGVIDTLRVDEVGVWAEAQLDLRQRYVRTVQRLVDKGVLAWSSGSLPHLVQVAGDGRIERWPLVEGSLTPAPAEPRRTDVQTLKSAYAALGLDVTRLEAAGGGQHDEQRTIRQQGEQAMHEDMQTMTDTPAARKRLPLADGQDAAAVPAGLKGGRISVSSPYDALDALDLLHGYVLLRATKNFRGVSEQYGNALASKLQRAGLHMGIKTDELSHSTQTGYGDEWVPDLWSAQLWQKARLENVVLPLFRSVEMPSNPFELPAEGTDPTVYFVPETEDEAHLSLGSGNPIPDSKIGSKKITLAAKKLALRVGFSAELAEDAIVPVLSLYREQAMRAVSAAIDHALLNGDTVITANTNINLIDGTPSATAVYLAFDGLRKQAVLGSSGANKVDAADAVPSLTLLRQARFKLALRYAARPNDLAWIVDGTTYSRFLAMSEFLTMDKAGALATAQTGQIGFVDGIPVLVSAELPLANGDGKVSATPGNNTQGTALCVYRPGWFVGYRRRIAVSVDYLPYYDSYQLTATVRLAFASYDENVTSGLIDIGDTSA